MVTTDACPMRLTVILNEWISNTPLGSFLFKLTLPWNDCRMVSLMVSLLVLGKSILIQVMAWCRQATSHYLKKCWSRSSAPYVVTGPPWFNIIILRKHDCDSKPIVTGAGWKKNNLYEIIIVPNHAVYHITCKLDYIYTLYVLYISYRDYPCYTAMSLITYCKWGPVIIY